jgi:outer membrane protein OmpA-like peptidoglycan-associated protein
LDGLQSAVAVVINGISQRSGDKGFLRQILQQASSTPDNLVTSAISKGALSNPSSPFMTGGTQLLSSIFGSKMDAVTEALGKQPGLKSGMASTLLALGAQTVLSFLGSRMREGSLNAGNAAAFLSRESDALQGRLPAAFQAAGSHKVEVDPVVAQKVVHEEKRGSILPWLLGLLALLLLLLGFWWYRSHQQPATPEVTQAPAVAPAPVAATVTSSAGANLGTLVDAPLSDGTVLHIPERGVEGRLLAFIKDPNLKPDKTTWFDFDRLLFNTNSDTLQPQSAEQLNNIAAILKAYPAVHLTIGGYTDNTGNAANNLRLSQNRANSVVDQLVKMGVDHDRLVAKGYGDQHPVGDNATEEGRALNRRISMLVTKK